MNFKTYDILSSLIPGFLVLLVLLNFFGISYEKDCIIPYTAIAFLIGYVVNTLSSWLEDVYYFTWGGKPSNNLLNGKGIWRIHFYDYERTKVLLIDESQKESPSNNHLFSIAMRYASGNKDSRVDDFNSNYAFSRAILTTVLVSIFLISIKNYDRWEVYAISLPILFLSWLRCKQRAYYYTKEVLNEYLKQKTKPV
jgi:hypothetical protein